ncbi:MAG: hypothetical protein ACRDI2_21195, partial [Chloroflexota bacterium]
LYVHVEAAGGRLTSVLALLDTGAAISVFDGRIAGKRLGFDPRAAPRDVVPLLGLLPGHGRLGYVHELRCFFGGYAAYAELLLHVAFTDPDDPEPPFNVLGREGLHGRQDRGLFSQVQFGYQHYVPGGPPEVYLTFRP